MALVKHNNNSLSAVTSMASLTTGDMILISEQTASGASTVSFTSGLDSTYPIYKFEFINIHPATDNVSFQFNMSTDGGSTYAVTKTTTYFYGYHFENDSATSLNYEGGLDLAQSTSDQPLSNNIGNDNDQSAVGTLHIFNPSSTTFVKHFISNTHQYDRQDISVNTFMAGYGNTTSAVDAVRFQMSSGNIDSGTIKLYGIKDS